MPDCSTPHVEAGSIPSPWLLVAETPKGLMAHRDFATRVEAEDEFREDKTARYGDSVYNLRVMEDTSTLKVCVHYIDLVRMHRVRLRENWIDRCASWLEGLLPEVRPTTAVVWEDREPGDVLNSCLGGGPVMRPGEANPKCSRCGKPCSFVGVLDFLGTPMRAHAGGDSFAAWFCFECGDGYEARWLSRGEGARRQNTPNGARQFRLCSGTHVTTRDLPSTMGDSRHPYWNPAADKEWLIGHSAYAKVTAFGTKIGGHQFWIQGDETPQCRCRRPMRWIAQFAGAFEMMFGDAGLLYVFRCASGACGDTKLVMQCF